MHPVLVKTPYFTIYSYGVCVALAVALAWALSHWLARRSGAPASQATDLLFVLFLSGLAGARLFYVFQHPEEYAGRWQAVFYLQQGGLVWYGGFLFAVVCGVAAVKRRGGSVMAWADLFSPVVALAHAVGRIGCFLNGCCFGKHGHPVQLYESALLAALSAGLFFRFFRKKKTSEIFALYLIGYGAIRFALEFLRGDQVPWMMLTIPQWISLGLLASGGWLWARNRP